jgi:hypothetical protein
MRKNALKSVRPDHPMSVVPTYSDGLEEAIQDTLARLADIETAYELMKERLDRWTGAAPAKERLAAQLERRHQRDREPCVQKLAELHHRLMSVTMFRTLH